METVFFKNRIERKRKGERTFTFLSPWRYND